MKVLVDNHSIPEFRVQIVCSRCQSQLEVNEVNDLIVDYHDDGDQRTGETWKVKHMAVRCPLCLKNIRIEGSTEKAFPRAVVRHTYEKA